MKKLIISLLMLTILTGSVSAKSVKRDFSCVIKNSGVDTNAISVSIKNIDSGNIVYGINDKILMHPASVQKILTTPISVEELGYDYKFSTKLYQRGKDSYVIKAGADPCLRSKELKTLTKQVKIDTEKIYIDDSITDDKTWGEGWQWDDDLNTLMPRFGAYNLDKNIAKITLIPSRDGGLAMITNHSKYPFVIFNNVMSGQSRGVNVKRDNSVSANGIMLSGSINKPVTIQIPINNIKLYYETKLTQSLEDNKVYIKENYIRDKVKSGDKEIAEITHDISPVIDDILKNSNNMASETIFKLAGKGTDIGGIELFNKYCSKNRLDNSNVKIVDGSGVSKNNLISADFITEFLILNSKNAVLERLPHPGEGTLVQRMLPLKDNLRAKTGTLSDVSSIAGFLTSKSGNKYVFCIMINDIKLSPSDKKMLEDFIVREAYLRL